MGTFSEEKRAFMCMNKGQLSEQLFWRWVNLSEQKWVNSSERHRLATFSPEAKSERLWPIAKTELGGPVTPVAFADGGLAAGVFFTTVECGRRLGPVNALEGFLFSGFSHL